MENFRTFEKFSGTLKIIFDILIIIVIGVISFILGTIVIGKILGIKYSTLIEAMQIKTYQNININHILLIQAIISFSFFIIGSYAVALFYSKEPIKYIRANSINSGKIYLMAIILILIIQPFINYTVFLSTKMNPLDSFPAIKSYLNEQSKLQQKLITEFLYSPKFTVLLRNLLIIALIPAIGEEMFFRSILQRHLIESIKNHHIGITLTAFIFAIVHMDYAGLYGRFILGLVLGYLFYWSKSLWLSVLVHFINNTMAIFLFFYMALKHLPPPQAVQSFNANHIELHIYGILSFILSLMTLLWIKKYLQKEVPEKQ